MENLRTNTANKPVVEEIISSTRVQQILNSNVEEVANLCKKASLRPRKDELGNVYFSKSDVDVLRKVKELYEHTRLLQEMKKKNEEQAPAANLSQIAAAQKNPLARIRTRLKNEITTPNVQNMHQYQTQQVTRQAAEVSLSKIQNAMSALEENIVSRMQELLSEKMDGLDEVVLELIRSKTENETLRQRLNELHKENFSLKTENSSYRSVGMGLYIKRSTGADY